MKSLLIKWWLYMCVHGVLAATGYKYNFFQSLVEKDPTRLSFLLLIILVVTSCWIGTKIYNYSRIENLDKESSTKDLAILWFIGEACLVIGLIGTVAGFIIMLGSTFTNLDVGDITSMTNALTTMSIGMSAALYTTLMGLISSLSIKIQLINLERTIQKI